jgi:hypothetical protein
MILPSRLFMRLVAAVCLTMGIVSCRSNVEPADSGGFIITHRLAEAFSHAVRGVVTSRLRSDYKVVKSSGDTIVFVKNVNGDTEAVVIHLNGGDESLHVRVELSLAPD